jgi:hypothetical protein
MGFRAGWLKHEGFLSVHSEDFLHIVDRLIPDTPLNILLVGVGNGGSVQVWRQVLPEGSTVTSIDVDPRTADLGLGIKVVDLRNNVEIKKVLSGSWFNVIIDATGDFMSVVWPFLTPGGLFIVDHYRKDILTILVQDVAEDRDSILPTEEIMSVTVFPNVIGVEKRNPRVVPYLEIITGTEDPIIKEGFYLNRGAKRVTPSPQTAP